MEFKQLPHQGVESLISMDIEIIKNHDRMVWERSMNQTPSWAAQMTTENATVQLFMRPLPSKATFGLL